MTVTPRVIEVLDYADPGMRTAPSHRPRPRRCSRGACRALAGDGLDWHVDTESALTMLVMLSDSDAFEGPQMAPRTPRSGTCILPTLHLRLTRFYAAHTLSLH